ncbi:hypothetical protein Fmac_025343 [Flemingia macrophylla]|uniref:Replication protein A 70 kDa DNA-binding subunit B/D first OB fold domain-containing protein n=1 Tax=Flemingia macrophylla TaxID=520843 RepID=A0ABD1LTP1_9FABA
MQAYHRRTGSILMKILMIENADLSSDSKNTVYLCGKVCCLTHPRETTHYFVRRTLIYKFQKEFHEGDIYSIQSFGVAENAGAYMTSRHTYELNF